MKKGKKPVDAVRAALPRLRGAFALAFLFAGEDNLMIGARKGSPLAVGYGEGEMFLGSDAIALAPFTNTISYLVADPLTKRAAIIDPVFDYDHASGKASTKSADTILDAAAAGGFGVDWVLETHAHADHLSGAPYIKLKTGAKVGIGEHIRDVQKIFRPVFNASDVTGDGSELFVKTTVDERDALVLSDPETFSEWWSSGRFGWVRVRLDRVEPDEAFELVVGAWRLTAPRRMVRAYDEGAGASG